MLDCQRHRFSLPPDVHYLNCAYMSPLPRSVEAAGIDGVRRKRFPADITPDDFFRDADTVRARFAALIGAADPTRVAILPAVSYGIAVAARNVPVARGQNIVISEGQFPSNVLAWRRLARERGAELRVVEAPGEAAGRSREWNTRILEAVDGGTAAVALPPVHWTDGTRFDLPAVGARARDVGAALIVDGTQAVGALPFDLETIRPDVLVCAAYKWLLGPYSLALGWFGPGFDDGIPLEEAWLARAGSEDFRNLVTYVDEYRPGAARYDVGGRGSFVLLPMAVAGLDQLLEWGVPAIAAYCGRLTTDLFDPLAERGFTFDDEQGRTPHLFGLRTPPDVDMTTLARDLERRRVYVSLRGTAIRVAPHLYNDATDVAALRDALLAASAAT